jgi:hypothetical protein
MQIVSCDSKIHSHWTTVPGTIIICCCTSGALVVGVRHRFSSSVCGILTGDRVTRGTVATAWVYCVCTISPSSCHLRAGSRAVSGPKISAANATVRGCLAVFKATERSSRPTFVPSRTGDAISAPSIAGCCARRCISLTT